MKTINKIGAPDPLATFEEKKTDAYGLAISRLIADDWFNGSFAVAGTPFANRRDYVRNKRLFIRGEDSVDYYKADKGDNGLDFVNIDWTLINWAEKFARIVSNGLSDKNYKLDVRATDKISVLSKEKKRDFFLKYMKNKEMIAEAKEKLGIDLNPQTFIPDDEEEMEMFMQIKDRPKVEIGEEILIDYVLNSNDWNVLSAQYDKDIVDVGLIVARIYTDKNDGVKVAYADCENYIHSQVTKNDFSDKYYEGLVETITISDLRRESGFTNLQLREIAEAYATYNKGTLNINYDTIDMDQLVDYKINILRFAYKTSKTIKFKKHIRKGKSIKVSKRSSDYISPDRSDVGMLSKTLDTWFEGNHVIATDFIYSYQECENLHDDIMNKAMSPFVSMAYDIYENRLRSFTGNIEPPARQLQKISLRIQQLLSELTPDLKQIDLDMLAELDDSKGGVKQEVWQTALDLMSAKGVIFTKRVNLGEDGMKDSAAVRPIAMQQGSALTALLNLWASYYNFIRENTGINPARDGSIPANSLVGVNQLAQLASNTVTANIVETSVQFKKKICEVISTRIHAIFKYKEASRIREVYENVLGKNMLDHLEVMKDRHLHEFGFFFTMNPTTEDLKDFNDALTLCIQSQTVDIGVAFQAKEIAKINTKQAIQYLNYHSRRTTKQREESQIRQFQEKSKADAMSNQSAEQAKLQSYQAKIQLDLQFQQQLAQIEIMKAQALLQITQPKDEREFEEKVFLKKLEGAASIGKQEFLEDRKDDRTKIQATQQSKMKQSNENDEPIDFEMENNFFTGL